MNLYDLFSGNPVAVPFFITFGGLIIGLLLFAWFWLCWKVGSLLADRLFPEPPET